VTRLCLIGNSHLIALQEALQAEPARWPGLDCTFHGFRGRTVLNTRVQDGVLVPTTDGARDQMQRYSGQARLEVAGQDAFAVVGLNLKLLHVMTFWKDARWHALPSIRQVPDLAALPHALISRMAAIAGLAGFVAGLTGMVLASRLAAALGKPVYVIGQPRLHRAALWGDQAAYFGLGRAIVNGDGPALAAVHDAAMHRAAARVGAIYLPQPGTTIHDHLLSRPRFMLGQVTDPASGRIRPDHTHPNARFGRLVLDQLARQVGVAP